MTEEQTSHGFDDLTNFHLDKDMIHKLTEDFCRLHHIVLLGECPKAGHDLIPVGMLNLTDDKLVFEVERKINRKTRRVQLNAYELDSALDFGFSDDTPDQLQSKILNIGKGRLFLSHDIEINFAHNQEADEMVLATLSQAIKRRASDIHIETYAHDVDVRFRIDGVLHQVATPFSLENIKKICSYIKILSELDITEHRRDQDGRISCVYKDESNNIRQIDMRLSVLPGPNGSDIVLRTLDENRISINMDDLGLNENIYSQFQKIIKKTGGLIIVAGPTASGKSTTLYSAIRDISTDHNKILTVEDPIEYEIPKVNQKQVSEHMSFAAYSRAFMRQNPDILMIGEVRDEETASIALRAAQMGHLVLTTIHAQNVLSTLSRLKVLCDDTSLVASGLVGILSQRLVRKICPDCAEQYDVDPELLKELPTIPSGTVFMKGAGCDKCHNTGYRGQTGVFELLKFNDHLRQEVMKGKDPDLNLISGFHTMYDDAIEKVRKGITSIEEVVRIVPLPE